MLLTIQELSKAQCNNTDYNKTDISKTDPILSDLMGGERIGPLCAVAIQF